MKFLNLTVFMMILTLSTKLLASTSPVCEEVKAEKIIKDKVVEEYPDKFTPHIYKKFNARYWKSVKKISLLWKDKLKGNKQHRLIKSNKKFIWKYIRPFIEAQTGVHFDSYKKMMTYLKEEQKKCGSKEGSESEVVAKGMDFLSEPRASIFSDEAAIHDSPRDGQCTIAAQSQCKLPEVGLSLSSSVRRQSLFK